MSLQGDLIQFIKEAHPGMVTYDEFIEEFKRLSDQRLLTEDNRKNNPMLTLRTHQAEVVATAPNKWALWFKQRVGKTPTAIRLASERCKSALVIVPKSLVSQWAMEIMKWRHDTCEFEVVSKENFRKHAAITDKYECVIVDEAHLAFANYKNQTYKALEMYLKKHDPKCIFLLTGTPKTATSWSIYSYGKLLGKQWKWFNWNQEFFTQIKMGNRLIPQPRAGTEPKLQNIIRGIGTVIDLKDIMDVPEDEEIIETFTLSPEQKRLIKEHFDPLPIVRYTAQHQIEQGVKKDTGYDDGISIQIDKDKRIVELAEQTEKIIIVCRYHDQIRKYAKLLAPLKRNIYEIHGQTKEENSSIARKAQDDPTAIVLAQSDVGVGFDLKSFDTMIFASMSYSFVNVDQMKSRIKSQEKHTSCTYIYLMTEGKSIDRAVYDAVQAKQNFNIELYGNN